MNGDWLGFLTSVDLNILLSGSMNLSGSLVFLRSFAKFTKSAVFGFHGHCVGTDCESVIGW